MKVHDLKPWRKEQCMCGIAGLINQSYPPPEFGELAARMGAVLAHRGPDDSGYWVDEDFGVLLVHRRLSIQDLSPLGHQPMKSPGGRYTMTFNGEIYNFKQLSKELQDCGFRFRGGSDTEVVLAAFEQWGVRKALEHFIGMFAIALYDTKKKVLYLCRDRMGEKPLYYGWHQGAFVFASELKSIFSAFPNKPKIDKGALSSFFRYGYFSAPFTILKGIYKLFPGSVLELPINQLEPAAFSPFVNDASNSPYEYWSLGKASRDGMDNLFQDCDQAVNDLDSLLCEVIQDQSIADVPTGAFLSGGIDSSTVAGIMQSTCDKRIDTFTIGFHEREFDEAPYAREIADHIGSNHHELYISGDDCLDVVQEIPKFWDEPFADSSQIPSLILSRYAKNEVTVCLSGDGGDELFCGYNRYTATERMWRKSSQLPAGLRDLFSRTLLSVPPSFFSTSYMKFKQLSLSTTTQANVGLKVHKFAEVMQRASLYDAYKFLMSYWADPLMVVHTNIEAPSVLDRSSSPGLGGFMNEAMFWDQLGYLPDDNLVKGDRASMAASLEARLPLLDHRVVEYSWKVPLEMKYRNGLSKWLLRQVLYRYVPQKLIERPKMGFSVPVAEWFRGPLFEWARDLLFPCDGEIINQKVVDQIWREHQAGKKDHGNKLWALAMYRAWAQCYDYE